MFLSKFLLFPFLFIAHTSFNKVSTHYRPEYIASWQIIPLLIHLYTHVYNRITEYLLQLRWWSATTKLLSGNKPLYLQIREEIEEQIVKNLLPEGEQVPSTNQLVNFYKVNHQTVAKGINQLVDEGILFKKRGVGMFVAKGAREKLLNKRKRDFVQNYIVSLVEEANILGLSEEDILRLIKQVKGRETNDQSGS